MACAGVSFGSASTDAGVALTSNFGGQWLYLRNVPTSTPDPKRFPQFNENLREAFRRETELFLDSQIREDRILPFVLRTLGEEIRDLAALLSAPPENLVQPYKEQSERRQQAEAERDELEEKIAKAEENILFVEDARTRKSLDKRVSEMRDELDLLNAELAAEPSIHRRELDPVPGQWLERDLASEHQHVEVRLVRSDHYVGHRREPTQE